MALNPLDVVAIQQLAAAYNHHIDAGEAPAWAATFTPDGTFTSRGTTHEGTAALTTFAEGFAERSGGALRHWITNVLVEGEGDEARLRCYLQILRTGDGAPTPVSSARYDDRVVRTPDGWRFAARTVVGDS